MVKKMGVNVEFTKKTKDYNLSTSLKNYIDPRVYKSWFDYVAWEKLYTTSLQRKFSWVAKSGESPRLSGGRGRRYEKQLR